MVCANLKNMVYVGVAIAALVTPAWADSTTGNWNGLYVGGHGGYEWGGFKNDNGFTGPTGSQSSWIGGVQVGNNWQFDHIVVSVEGDASALDVTSRSSGGTYDEDWMSTMRGRVGYSLNQTLPYVTAGLGLTDVVSNAPGQGSDSRIQPGAALGGGMDFKLTPMGSAPSHWIGRVEYLHVDVPKGSDTVGNTMVAGGSGNNIVRAGLNYQF